MASVIFAHAADMWHQCRDEFEDYVAEAYRRAERATNGHMVNREGRAKGVTSLSLFTGQAARAHRYASEELLDHWRAHPRLTFAQFEEQWAQTGLLQAA